MVAKLKRKLVWGLVLILALGAAVALVRRQTEIRKGAYFGGVELFLLPTQKTMKVQEEAEWLLKVNPRNFKIAAARLQFSFEPQLIEIKEVNFHPSYSLSRFKVKDTVLTLEILSSLEKVDLPLTVFDLATIKVKAKKEGKGRIVFHGNYGVYEVLGLRGEASAADRHLRVRNANQVVASLVIESAAVADSLGCKGEDGALSLLSGPGPYHPQDQIVFRVTKVKAPSYPAKVYVRIGAKHYRNYEPRIGRPQPLVCQSEADCRILNFSWTIPAADEAGMPELLAESNYGAEADIAAFVTVVTEEGAACTDRPGQTAPSCFCGVIHGLKFARSSSASESTPTPVVSGSTPTPTAGAGGMACSCERALSKKQRMQGDFNCDGRTDLDDYTLWRLSYYLEKSQQDFDCTDGPGTNDFTTWVNNFGGER